MARGLGPRAGDEFPAEIESLDQEGRGVAHREGKAVFIEGALPGERVVYERRKNKPSYETGRVVRIDRPSVLRVEPRCPHAGLHAGACGGCSMQHVAPHAQVAIKQRVLEDTLWHIGRVRPDRMLRPVAGPAWEYRFRARFSVRYVAKKGGVLVGFHERASSYVADMRRCEVVPRYVSDLLMPLRELVARVDAARAPAADRTGHRGARRHAADRPRVPGAGGPHGRGSGSSARVRSTARRRRVAAAEGSGDGGADGRRSAPAPRTRAAGVRRADSVRPDRLHPGQPPHQRSPGGPRTAPARPAIPRTSSSTSSAAWATSRSRSLRRRGRPSASKAARRSSVARGRPLSSTDWASGRRSARRTCSSGGRRTGSAW